ncbi:MAG: hypothetical protein JO251_00455 [Verrucomicrobia bacterium]|nr:hypothetical protein [Verrucomicrobiota bacterium]
MALGLGSLFAFLEEGQNDDWFTSVFIQRCFALAVIFIPLFIICELVSKTPVVNLRLLRLRTLGIASAVNFLLGASLYGSVFLLPEYLEQVQQYSAKQEVRCKTINALCCFPPSHSDKVSDELRVAEAAEIVRQAVSEFILSHHEEFLP